MPYFDQLDDESNKDQQDSGSGNGGQISAGSQVLGAGNPTLSNAQTAQTNAAKGSGQFANLDEYLRVNAPQQFGTQLAGKVNNDITQAGDTVTQAGDAFKTRADAATVQTNQDLINQATGTDAANFAADSNNVANFQKQLDASYQGPTSFSDASDLYNQATGAVQTAEGKAQSGSSEGGRFALLDNYYGKPSYNTGQKSLDNLLVQNDPNSQQAFQQIQQNADQVAQQAKTVADQANTYGAQAKGTTEATAQAARDALGIDTSGKLTGTGAFGDVNNAIQNNVSQYTQDLTQTQADVANALKTGDLTGLTDAEKSALGLSGFTGPTYGLDLSQYATYANPTSINTSTVTTADQAARLNALAQLAGLTPQVVETTDLGTAPDAANQYVTFDTSRLNTDAAGKAAAYNTALSAKSSVPGPNPNNTINYMNYINSSGNSITNPSPAPWMNQTSGYSLTQMQSDLTAAINKLNTNSFFDQGTSRSVIDPQLQASLNAVNSQIAALQGQYGASTYLKQ